MSLSNWKVCLKNKNKQINDFSTQMKFRGGEVGVGD